MRAALRRSGGTQGRLAFHGSNLKMDGYSENPLGPSLFQHGGPRVKKNCKPPKHYRPTRVLQASVLPPF
jgi:hypothetical protein